MEKHPKEEYNEKQVGWGGGGVFILFFFFLLRLEQNLAPNFIPTSITCARTRSLQPTPQELRPDDTADPSADPSTVVLAWCSSMNVPQWSSSRYAPPHWTTYALEKYPMARQLGNRSLFTKGDTARISWQESDVEAAELSKQGPL